MPFSKDFVEAILVPCDSQACYCQGTCCTTNNNDKKGEDVKMTGPYVSHIYP